MQMHDFQRLREREFSAHVDAGEPGTNSSTHRGGRAVLGSPWLARMCYPLNYQPSWSDEYQLLQKVSNFGILFAKDVQVVFVKDEDDTLQSAVEGLKGPDIRQAVARVWCTVGQVHSRTEADVCGRRHNMAQSVQDHVNINHQSRLVQHRRKGEVHCSCPY